MNLTTQHDQHQQRSVYSTRLLSESLSKKKKLFSFLSDRNAHTVDATSSTAPSSKSNPFLDDVTTYSGVCPTTTFASTAPTRSPLIRSFLDDSDSHFLRKTLTKFQNKVKQRQDILKQNILPWFRNKQQTANTAKSSSSSPSSTRLDQARPILLRWWGTLLSYVQHINYTERSLYFECIVEIMARSEFIPYDNTNDTFDDWYSSVEDTIMANRSHLQEYKHLLIATLHYAIAKLNHKAIYSNMISFCAKILAFGFIKIPGLASSLIQLLPVQKIITNRLVMEMGDLKHHVEYKSRLLSILPGHLQPIMVWNLSQYKQHIRTNQKQKSPVGSTGNWIRRWQSDDSELFFSFYRHYHVVLKNYITVGFPSIHTYDLHQRNTILAVSPGYLYLASYFAGKIDALLHRRLHSVTTFPQQPIQQSTTPSSPSFTTDLFNASSIDTTIRSTSPQDKELPLLPHTDDTQSQQTHTQPTNDLKSTSSPSSQSAQQTAPSSNPNFFCQSSGKPAPLEMATQRYGECLVWCVMMAEPVGLYHDMMNVWIRTIVKTTSMMAVESVFCLMDFIDVVILETRQIQTKQTNNSLGSSRTIVSNPPLQPMDLPFLLYTLQLIFLHSDHAITLLRALSFVYTNFDFLVPSSALLEFMCSRILLATPIFERLLLHWNRNIRTFFLRCLIWRIGRTWNTASVKWSPLMQLLTTSPPMDERTSIEDPIHSSKSINNNASTRIGVCNGNDCWKALTRSQDTKRTGNEQDQKDYIRCSLQVHILLETLIDSFQQRYLELDPSTLDAEKATATTVQPDKIQFYKSNLPSSSLDSLLDQLPLQSYSLPTTSSPVHLNHSDSNISTDKRQLQKRNHQKQQSAPLSKKHNLFARPALATMKKDKWMKLFSFATSSSASNSSFSTVVKKPPAINQQHQNNAKEKHVLSSYDGNTLAKLDHGYYYKVSDVYTWKTPTSTLHGSHSMHSKLDNLANKTSDMDGVDRNKGGDRTDEGKSNNRAKSTHSKSVSHLDRIEDTDTEYDDEDDEDDDDEEDDDDGFDRDDGTIDTSPASSSFVTLPATYIQTAKTWRYAKSNHVYATKILGELDLILNEYIIWTEKISLTRMFMDERKVDSSNNINSSSRNVVDEDQNGDADDNGVRLLKIGAPELTLDWPKNWSFSQF